LKALTLTDIQPPSAYAAERDQRRRQIISLKRHRRVSVGDRVTMVFENRATLLFQTEEMLRVENLTSDEQILAELEVYNALMPTEDSLSATLFLEVPPDTDARVELDRLIGLDEHVVLHIGDHPVRAAFEEGRSETDRISAVQYTRYPLSPAAKAALLAENTLLRLEIDHPEYRHQTPLTEAMRQSLASDFLA